MDWNPVTLKNKLSKKLQNSKLPLTIQNRAILKQILRQKFVQDFVAVWAKSDIPLEKLKKLPKFVGALPENESETHLPCVISDLKHLRKIVQCCVALLNVLL